MAAPSERRGWLPQQRAEHLGKCEHIAGGFTHHLVAIVRRRLLPGDAFTSDLQAVVVGSGHGFDG